jgi:hypothetical protein
MAEAGGQDPPLFGEMSFVESTSGRASASANIIADSDDVTFSILEGVKLFCLFVAQPQMAGRFYRYPFPFKTIFSKLIAFLQI